jgi:hypothetical protein
MTVWAGAVLLIFLAAGTHAAVIYQTGFEAPSFSTGQLSGQNGWASDNTGTNLAVVQNSVANEGTQAGYTPRGEDVNNTLTAWRDVSNPDEYNYVTIETALRVDDMAASSSYFDAFYIYQNNYQNSRAAILYFRGDGNILIPEAGVGDVDVGDWAADTWYDIRFLLNYNAQTLDLWIDDMQVLSAFPFLESSSTDIGGIAYQEYGGTTGGGFYYDGLDIGGYSMPEPETGALFLLAGAGLLYGFRQRRRSAITAAVAIG